MAEYFTGKSFDELYAIAQEIISFRSSTIRDRGMQDLATEIVRRAFFYDSNLHPVNFFKLPSTMLWNLPFADVPSGVVGVQTAVGFEKLPVSISMSIFSDQEVQSDQPNKGVSSFIGHGVIGTALNDGAVRFLINKVPASIHSLRLINLPRESGIIPVVMDRNTATGHLSLCDPIGEALKNKKVKSLVHINDLHPASLLVDINNFKLKCSQVKFLKDNLSDVPYLSRVHYVVEPTVLLQALESQHSSESQKALDDYWLTQDVKPDVPSSDGAIKISEQKHVKESWSVAPAARGSPLFTNVGYRSKLHEIADALLIKRGANECLEPKLGPGKDLPSVMLEVSRFVRDAGVPSPRPQNLLEWYKGQLSMSDEIAEFCGLVYDVFCLAIEHGLFAFFDSQLADIKTLEKNHKDLSKQLKILKKARKKVTTPDEILKADTAIKDAENQLANSSQILSTASKDIDLHLDDLIKKEKIDNGPFYLALNPYCWPTAPGIDPPPRQSAKSTEPGVLDKLRKLLSHRIDELLNFLADSSEFKHSSSNHVSAESIIEQMVDIKKRKVKKGSSPRFSWINAVKLPREKIPQSIPHGRLRWFVNFIGGRLEYLRPHLLREKALPSIISNDQKTWVASFCAFQEIQYLISAVHWWTVPPVDRNLERVIVKVARMLTPALSESFVLSLRGEINRLLLEDQSQDKKNERALIKFNVKSKSGQAYINPGLCARAYLVNAKSAIKNQKYEEEAEAWSLFLSALLDWKALHARPDTEGEVAGDNEEEEKSPVAEEESQIRFLDKLWNVKIIQNMAARNYPLIVHLRFFYRTHYIPVPVELRDFLPVDLLSLYGDTLIASPEKLPSLLRQERDARTGRSLSGGIFRVRHWFPQTVIDALNALRLPSLGEDPTRLEDKPGGKLVTPTFYDPSHNTTYKFTGDAWIYRAATGLGYRRIRTTAGNIGAKIAGHAGTQIKNKELKDGIEPLEVAARRRGGQVLEARDANEEIDKALLEEIKKDPIDIISFAFFKTPSARAILATSKNTGQDYNLVAMRSRAVRNRFDRQGSDGSIPKGIGEKFNFLAMRDLFNTAYASVKGEVLGTGGAAGSPDKARILEQLRKKGLLVWLESADSVDHLSKFFESRDSNLVEEVIKGVKDAQRDLIKDLNVKYPSLSRGSIPNGMNFLRTVARGCALHAVALMEKWSSFLPRDGEGEEEGEGDASDVEEKGKEYFKNARARAVKLIKVARVLNHLICSDPPKTLGGFEFLIRLPALLPKGQLVRALGSAVSKAMIMESVKQYLLENSVAQAETVIFPRFNTFHKDFHSATWQIYSASAILIALGFGPESADFDDLKQKIDEAWIARTILLKQKYASQKSVEALDEGEGKPESPVPVVATKKEEESYEPIKIECWEGFLKKVSRDLENPEVNPAVRQDPIPFVAGREIKTFGEIEPWFKITTQIAAGAPGFLVRFGTLPLVKHKDKLFPETLLATLESKDRDLGNTLRDYKKEMKETSTYDNIFPLNFNPLQGEVNFRIVDPRENLKISLGRHPPTDKLDEWKARAKEAQDAAKKLLKEMQQARSSLIFIEDALRPLQQILDRNQIVHNYLLGLVKAPKHGTRSSIDAHKKRVIDLLAKKDLGILDDSEWDTIESLITDTIQLLGNVHAWDGLEGALASLYGEDMCNNLQDTVSALQLAQEITLPNELQTEVDDLLERQEGLGGDDEGFADILGRGEDAAVAIVKDTINTAGQVRALTEAVIAKIKVDIDAWEWPYMDYRREQRYAEREVKRMGQQLGREWRRTDKDHGRNSRWRITLLQEARKVLSECPAFVEYICGPNFAYFVRPPKRIRARIQKDRAVIQSMQVIPPANTRRHVLVNMCLKAPAYVEPWITPVKSQAGNVSVEKTGDDGKKLVEKRELAKALIGTDVNRFQSERQLAYSIGFADHVLWEDLAKEPVSALHLALLLGSYERRRGDNAHQFIISEQGARHLARVARSIIFNEDATAPTFKEILGDNDIDVFATKEGESALSWPSPAEPYNDYARERVPTFNDKLLAPVILWGAEWGHLTGHAMKVLNKINKIVSNILKNAKSKAGSLSQEDLWEKAKEIERQKARNKKKNNLRLILRLERHYTQLQAKVTTKRLAGLRYLKRTVPYMLRRFPVKGISYEDLSFQKAGLTAPAGFTGAAAQAMKSMPKRFGDWVARGFWYLKQMGMLRSGGTHQAAVWAGGTSQVCAHHPDPPRQGRIDRKGSADSGVCSVGRESYVDDRGNHQEGPEIVISHDSAAGIIAFRGHAVLAKKMLEKASVASDTGPPR